MRYAKARRVRGVMNKTEAEYEKLFLGHLPHAFEAVTLILADDCRYTPDFMVIAEDDVVEFHEIKGGHIREDSTIKLRMAAKQFPWFRFKRFQYRGKQWSVKSFGQEDAA